MRGGVGCAKFRLVPRSLRRRRAGEDSKGAKKKTQKCRGASGLARVRGASSLLGYLFEEPLIVVAVSPARPSVIPLRLKI